MTYCRRCRIFIEHDTETHCPLCDTLLCLQKEEEKPEDVFFAWRKLKKAQEHDSFWYTPKVISHRKVVNIVLDFLILALFSSILILATVDLYQYNRMGYSTMSPYLPSVALFYSIISLLIIRLYRLKLSGQWLILLNTALFLLAIDLCNEQPSWSLHTGAIIVFGGLGPFLLLQILWRKLPIKGFNFIGFIAIAISISLISLDKGFSRGWSLQGWSLFTFTSLLFLSLLFLYLHYIAKVHVNFDPIVKINRTVSESEHHEL